MKRNLTSIGQIPPKAGLLLLFCLVMLQESFAQCNTMVTANVISFCGPGCFGDVTFASSGGTPPYDLVVIGGPTVQYSTSYNWTNVCAGSYQYTVTDAALSCTDTGTVTIVSNPLPVVTASLASNICMGDTVTLLAVGALGYTWSPVTNLISASIDSSSVTVNPVVTTTYTVVGYTIEGCTASDTVTVFVNPLPLLFPLTDIYLCYGGSAIISVSGAASYAWSPATGLSATTGTPVTANPTTTTTYTVIGTSLQGCTSSITFTIYVLSLPSITFNLTNESCSGCCDGSITATAPGAASYMWSNSALSPVNTNLCSGTYSITVFDINGCSSGNSATIGVGTCNPSFSVVPDNFTPHMYWITNNVTGTAPISYLWTWGDATSDTIPFPSHTYAAAGFYDICLAITDAAGCSCANCWSSNLARMDAANTMISVTVVSQIPTEALENNEEDFILFPNPAANELRIKPRVLGTKLRIEDVEIYNVMGEKVFSTAVPSFSFRRRSLEDEVINISTLIPGIYFVKVKTSDQENTQKLIVLH